MSPFEKVSKYLGQSTGLVEVREWAHVYWVKYTLGRPTMLSKKMVDRASQMDVMVLASSDVAVRDNASNSVYVVRKGCYGVTSASIKRIRKGQSITQWSDFSELRGEIFTVPFGEELKPKNLRQLIVHQSVVYAA